MFVASAYMLAYCISVTIGTHPVNTTECAGETAVFNGVISTPGNLNIVWNKFITLDEYKNLPNSQPKYKIFQTFSSEDDAVYGSLSVINVTTDDEGWYMFEAGSDVISNRVYLNVITAPGTIICSCYPLIT